MKSIEDQNFIRGKIWRVARMFHIKKSTISYGYRLDHTEKECDSMSHYRSRKDLDFAEIIFINMSLQDQIVIIKTKT